MPDVLHTQLKTWLESLETFIAALKQHGCKAKVTFGPPAPPPDFDRLQKTGRTIPKTLAAFAEISGKVRMDFAIQDEALSDTGPLNEVLGSLHFNFASISKHLKDAREWAEDTWIAEYPEDKELWLGSIPIFPLENGDYIGLDIRTPADDPPVVYLNHEDASTTISPSFTSFLREWHSLYFVGPELGLLEPFLNENGYLDSTTEVALEFRKPIDEFLAQSP